MKNPLISPRLYPQRFKGPAPIEYQIKNLALYLDLDPDPALKYVENLLDPPTAEGWFATLSDQGLQKLFPGPKVIGEGCTESQLKRLREIENGFRVDDESRLERYRAGVDCLLRGELFPSPLTFCWSSDFDVKTTSIDPKTKASFDLITENQPGDILIVAAQLGDRHRNCSPLEDFDDNEFGIDILTGGCIAFNHPSLFLSDSECSLPMKMICSGSRREGDDSMVAAYVSGGRMPVKKGGPYLSGMWDGGEMCNDVVFIDMIDRLSPDEVSPGGVATGFVPFAWLG